MGKSYIVVRAEVPDEADRAQFDHWYATDHDAAHWKPIRIGLPWQEQGYQSYRGIGWYRASVRLPAKLPGAGVGFPEFRGSLSLGDRQRRAERGLQHELALGTLKGVG